MSQHVKLNLPAFTAFRQSSGVQAAVRQAAEGVAARANAMGSLSHGGKPEYRASSVQDSPKGSIAIVEAVNHQAFIDNTYHNTLAKALGGGG